MSHSLQEKAGRWCHQFACLVLTLEVYGLPMLKIKNKFTCLVESNPAK